MTNTKLYNAKDFDYLLKAIIKFKDIQFIFTLPNIDKGHELITVKIKKFVLENKRNSIFIKSLDKKFFLFIEIFSWDYW